MRYNVHLSSWKAPQENSTSELTNARTQEVLTVTRTLENIVYECEDISQRSVLSRFIQQGNEKDKNSSYAQQNHLEPYAANFVVFVSSAGDIV